ncbi:MAG TPA: exodeoxyribonuclease VII large subunit [Nitrospirae bacterium]|nr:exodeoxyribonuclease VII large subunit [Nitrospirota bacterium]
MSEVLSLFELNNLIRNVIEGSLPDTFLVTAEIASCNVKNHCYMTLVDKADGQIRAETGAVIWADRYRSIARTFERQTGTALAKGIKILIEAEVSFHERYGLKLNIINIDPSYTIGEMAVRRKEVLERLTKEGLIERNRELEFPLVPQRIGIVSSSTAAGYEDLMVHLENNSYSYKFTTTLYEAIMQGDRAEESVAAALGRCAEDASSLDLVVIVRGGGGQVDLHCFDSYGIGKAIAMLPVPVISGIGHQRDVTVVDEVSNMRAKTPTAVADMIITTVKDFEDRLDSSAHSLVRFTREMTSEMKSALSALSKILEAAARNELVDNSHRLGAFIKGLQYSLKFIKNEGQRLRSGEGNIKLLDPRSILKRGYSITYNNDKAVRAASDVKTGDSLRTVFFKGEVTSKVENKKR